jgi:hypothetical protein
MGVSDLLALIISSDGITAVQGGGVKKLSVQLMGQLRNWWAATYAGYRRVGLGKQLYDISTGQSCASLLCSYAPHVKYDRESKQAGKHGRT